jgi:hypothetical protein
VETRFVAAWVLAFATIGCGSETPPPQETEQVLASAAVAAVAPSCDAASDEARLFRVQYGLRADECWIQAVAADPAAQPGIADFGVPLMPFEAAELRSRHTNVDLLREINGYGALFPASYAGAYVDARASEAFVASFKNEALRHRVALANLVPAAQIEVLDVDWSTIELDRFVRAVEAERAWFQTIRVQYITADRGITDNFVSVDYLGPAAAAQVIEGHFGDPTWLVAERQGPLPWAGPRGDLVIVVVDQDGKPVPGLWCEFVAEDPEAGNPGEDIFGTDDSGRCIIPNLPAVAYRVTLHRFVDDDHYEPIEQLRVVLSSGGTTISAAVEMP